MAKIDLADGCYRVPLSPTAALSLAVIIPADIATNPSPLVAIPLALPMGWTHSPPFFCAYTETIADIANHPPNNPLPDHNLLTTTILHRRVYRRLYGRGTAPTAHAFSESLAPYN
jgi:hypothetical protein